jgi:hypothetical protein
VLLDDDEDPEDVEGLSPGNDEEEELLESCESPDERLRAERAASSI